MDRFFSLCLQGDINAAMEYLNSIQPKTKEIEKLQQMYIERFFSQKSEENILTDDSWIRDVVSAYHDYFRTVLTNADVINDAELNLNNSLRRYLQIEAPLNIDETENELAKIFNEKGYSFLGGVTPPFRGAYIWNCTETVHFNVEIPQQSIPVSVHLMSDFILEGWMGYATFNNRSVGGWANEDGLYCNIKRYKDLDDDQFQVSYLKHEAQHLYDYKYFPGLKSYELEYRAKLVELIYSKNHLILEKFLNDAKNDPDFPHPYASFNIIKNLSSSLFNKDYEPNINVWLEKDYKKISSTALKLLEKNSSEIGIES
ncbi:hypothetical protein V7161_26575 [Neobacillus drentensis]|uniref:hypothetical protein n=1 Tax=Neobacillus drentensis TaxID=220684 RepID=UPI003002CAE7